MIICAALKLVHDKLPGGELIIPCWRHGYGHEIAKTLNAKLYLKSVKIEGFIDHDGVFYDREDALYKAYACGQIPQAGRWYKSDHMETRELYSEDLY